MNAGSEAHRSGEAWCPWPSSGPVDPPGEAVRDAVDIVAIASEHTRLRKAGRRLAPTLPAGATFDDVVRVGVYVRHMADRELINTVRRRYFGDARPASTLVSVIAAHWPAVTNAMPRLSKWAFCSIHSGANS